MGQIPATVVDSHASQLETCGRKRRDLASEQATPAWVQQQWKAKSGEDPESMVQRVGRSGTTRCVERAERFMSQRPVRSMQRRRYDPLPASSRRNHGKVRRVRSRSSSGETSRKKSEGPELSEDIFDDASDVAYAMPIQYQRAMRPDQHRLDPFPPPLLL
ncbi:chromatin regulatory protein [Pseudozyma hubeiensis SY62]|uniref:Chromatin regulatory protein n=1 Tax=Pseudozyma hubeiensis (strain SY62) TaxID=1305764 RepID=R9P0B4_PSEHS|nr:chromatin regulatory protein [Pseudozyma hubeiensis SY62]GAC94633.1 chromatin regulatory protein [Pseudozyma hubeiensis SY62]